MKSAALHQLMAFSNSKESGRDFFKGEYPDGRTCRYQPAGYCSGRIIGLSNSRVDDLADGREKVCVDVQNVIRKQQAYYAKIDVDSL